MLENDSPYGNFGFPNDEREVSIPEDYNVGDVNTITKELNVDRMLGRFGAITVSQ